MPIFQNIVSRNRSAFRAEIECTFEYYLCFWTDSGALELTIGAGAVVTVVVGVVWGSDINGWGIWQNKDKKSVPCEYVTRFD